MGARGDLFLSGEMGKMMATITEIREHIRDTAKYSGMSYAAIVEVAVEVESVEDKIERAKLRREFHQEHALTSVIWARVAKRFPDYNQYKKNGIRALAYMCQLPHKECMLTWEAHVNHLDEPGAHLLVLNDVNTDLDRKKTSRAQRKPKDAAVKWRDVVYRVLHSTEFMTGDPMKVMDEIDAAMAGDNG